MTKPTKEDKIRLLEFYGFRGTKMIFPLIGGYNIEIDIGDILKIMKIRKRN